MDEEATKNLIKQIHEVWVNPEVAKRNFLDPIFAILIIFKPGVSEVLFNGETNLIIEIDPSVGGKLVPGEPVTATELAKRKIKSIRVPEEIFDNYGFIAATVINGQWNIYFNFVPNKTEAKEKLELAEGFINAAEGTNNEKVRAYNIFQAVEQAVHASLLNHPTQQDKIKKAKTHSATKSLVNIQSKQGNVPKEIAQLFNKLHENRSKIYSRDKIGIKVSEEDIGVIKGFIKLQKHHITQ